jgi:uncharacterized protein YjbI with pentapeptide repeats
LEIFHTKGIIRTNQSPIKVYPYRYLIYVKWSAQSAERKANSKQFRSNILTQPNRNESTIKQSGFMVITILILAVFTLPVNASCSDRGGPGVDWSGCKKSYKMLNQQDFSNAKFNESDLSSGRLDSSDFTDGSLIKADLSRSNAKNSLFKRTNMLKSMGYHTDFSASRFIGAILVKSEFSRANFENAIFQQVDWSRAEIGRAEFNGASLDGVKFENSNLSRARFSGATLLQVDFIGAYTFYTRFEGVDLSSSKNITQAQINMACGDNETVLPSGLSRPTTWPCSSD